MASSNFRRTAFQRTAFLRIAFSLVFSLIIFHATASLAVSSEQLIFKF
jgi:hypothetical protein